MGTFLKSTWVPCPVPLRARVSSSISFACICHDGSSAGQVVKFTSCSVTLPLGVDTQAARGAARMALGQLELCAFKGGAERGRVAARCCRER